MSGYRGSRGVGPRDGGEFAPDRRSWRGGGGAARSHPYSRDGPPGPNHQRRGRGEFTGPPPSFHGDRMQYRGERGGGGQGNRGGRRGPPMLPPPQRPEPEEEKIDRTKICPLLLRVYIQKDKHHSQEQFAVRGEEPNSDSIVIYTWMDASLRELAELIQLVNADARRPNTEISFAFVYPDRTGTNVIKHVQTIQSYRNNKASGPAAQRGQEDQKTLRSLKFETGDFLSVALLG